MQRALFLDRDGVVNHDKNYLYKINELEWVDGIFELTKFATEKMLPIFIVTNQSGIARGFYSEADFNTINDYMISVFKQNNVNVTDVFYCPFHPDANIEKYKLDHPWRKPKPGMFFAAKELYSIDLTNSFMIGDRETDAEAASTAGISNIALLDPSGQFKNIPIVTSLPDLFSCIAWIDDNI